MPSPFANELVALLPRMRRFARALAGTADRADDLVQGACERALRAQASFVPGTRLDAWMFRIIRNLWIDGLRVQGAEPWRHAPIEDAEAVTDNDGASRMEAMLTLDKAREAILALPPEQREVVVMVCIEEMSYRDAAEMLSLPIGTVMSRLARGRRRIAEMLGLSDEAAR